MKDFSPFRVIRGDNFVFHAKWSSCATPLENKEQSDFAIVLPGFPNNYFTSEKQAHGVTCLGTPGAMQTF